MSSTEQALVAVNHDTQLTQTQTTEALILSISELKTRRNVIVELLKEIMQEGVHYGVIPGTQKPSLLKAGAELICSTFRLAPRYEIQREDLGEGHRSYEISTTLYHVGTQAMWGQGVGSCSTMESKYRYMRGNEHPDIANTYNTCLKMAKKRSLVDAILTATAASDMFYRRDEDEEGEDQTKTEEKKPGPAHIGLTPQQIGFLMAACKEFGVTEDRLKIYLKEHYGIESRKDIPQSMQPEILAWVKKQKS